MNADSFFAAQKCPLLQKNSHACLNFGWLVQIIEKTFCTHPLSSSEKKQLWEILLLRELMPSTKLDKLPRNAYFKRRGSPEEGYPFELTKYALNPGISFLTDYSGNLYALTKLYLHFDKLKKFRLAIDIKQLSLFLVYSSPKNSP
ncbi:hypothetical protein PHSC3_001327 [Chlamydiales bacterium STE3]|nr:hypothetical protein PHSC3_001327 [Chlamydiales bacterium STE3]